MGSNSTKTGRRRNIWDKTGGVCAHCGKVVYGQGQTVDHFIPKSLGGTYDTRNLMPLCEKCNKIRDTKKINPINFYKYANRQAIKDCLDYKKKWKMEHTNYLGEIY